MRLFAQSLRRGHVQRGGGEAAFGRQRMNPKEIPGASDFQGLSLAGQSEGSGWQNWHSLRTATVKLTSSFS